MDKKDENIDITIKIQEESYMIISINEMSEIPIYQQIRNQIVQGISDGRLSPGEQLPTVRGLAEAFLYQHLPYMELGSAIPSPCPQW